MRQSAPVSRARITPLPYSSYAYLPLEQTNTNPPKGRKKSPQKNSYPLRETLTKTTTNRKKRENHVWVYGAVTKDRQTLLCALSFLTSNQMPVSTLTNDPAPSASSTNVSNCNCSSCRGERDRKPKHKKIFIFFFIE